VAGSRLVGLTVVLDGVHDPHNISAVLRSCEGFGVQNVHLIGSPDTLPVNTAITKNCQRWLSLHYHDSAALCAGALHSQGFELWAAMPDRESPTVDEIDFSRKTALVFGGEKDGISGDLLALCDRRYRIPMPGFSQSLNVSVAAAISIHVACAARRRALGRPTDLTSDQVESLARRWIEEDKERRQRHGRCDRAHAVQQKP
jgi:tRNA (guanosine-2'-O-)-methyltransferase